MEETITIQDIVKMMKKRWKLIFLMTLLIGTIGSLFTFYVLTPKYQASSQILVNQKNTEIDSNQYQNNVDLINTYSVIIKSPVILGKVIENLNLNQSVNELNRKITVSSQENSLVFSLTVEDINSKRAVDIVNEISETFQREISGIMNVDNVSILARAAAENNPTPIFPNNTFNIIVAVIVGLLAGIVISLLLEFLDNTLKDANDIESILDLPVLGSIQKLPQKHSDSGANILLMEMEGEKLEA